MITTIAIALVIVIFTTAAYMIKNTRFKKRYPPRQQSIPGGDKKEGESLIYRHPLTPHGKPLLKVHPDFPKVTTYWEAFQNGLHVEAEHDFLGTRSVDGPYVWESYQEVAERVKAFRSGLNELGLSKQNKLSGKMMVGVYAKNQAEWMITQLACSSLSLVVVPLYDTLGHDAIEYIINQTELSVVVVEPAKLELLLKCAPKCKSLKYVVKIGSSLTQEEKALAKGNVSLLHFRGVEALGKDNQAKVPDVPPKPEDVVTICYTSGTTGSPKGVIVTHGNFIAECAGVFITFPPDLKLDHNEVHLSFLPLAHIFEQLVTCSLMCVGAKIGFYSGDVLKLMDDIALVKPTVFPAVPRLLNRIQQKVFQNVKESSLLVRLVFNFALAQKKVLLRQGIITRDSLWDKLVFRKIQQRLGGRVRLIISGAAAISNDTLEFLRCAFGCETLEGFGQTETAAAITVTAVGDYSTEANGHVGCVIPCCEIKLVDCPDLEYLSSDKPNPRGEICVRGNNIFQGYYKMEDKTRETLDKEGWCHSGDIGMFLPNGTLKVIDRKKNLFKLAQGEYIAAEKIENVYSKCDLAAQVFVHGESLKTCLVGIVTVEEPAAKKWAKNNGKAADVQALCNDQDFQKALLEELQQLGKQAKLHSFEQVKAIHLDHEQFSVDNDLLTPTFKAKRDKIKKKYAKQIDQMYEKLE